MAHLEEGQPLEQLDVRQPLLGLALGNAQLGAHRQERYTVGAPSEFPSTTSGVAF